MEKNGVGSAFEYVFFVAIMGCVVGFIEEHGDATT